MNKLNNLILNTDAYKTSHWEQPPDGTTSTYFYFGPRWSKIDGVTEVVNFGLTAVLEALKARVTEYDVYIAEGICKQMGIPFNKEGWEYILRAYDGFLPVRIRQAPEGLPIPIGNAFFSVESLDDKCYWVPSYLETILVRTWYPCTVATLSRECRKILTEFANATCDTDADGQYPWLDFQLHDFGARGVSSFESAGIGGAAHLVNFKGTDTISAILVAHAIYNAGPDAGFSVPAAEHSTQTPYGPENEKVAYQNMIDLYGNGIFSVVSDSWDVYNAVKNIWIGEGLIDQVAEKGGKIVIRPDSGDPTQVPIDILTMLFDRYGRNENSKGYAVLPPFVGVLQGDGINLDSIRQILQKMKDLKIASQNIVFGMGGALLQKVDRDTFGFAMKCSSIVIDGEIRDVSKNPVTMSSKKSLAGRVELYESVDGYATFAEGKVPDGYTPVFKTVFDTGEFMNNDDFDTIRARAAV